MKINLNATVKPTRMIDIINSKCISMERANDGTVKVVVPFPGCKAVEMTRDDMYEISLVLQRTVPMGDGIADTFERTASINKDGTLTARFEEKDRARSVEFTMQDREDIIALFEQLSSDWDAHVAAFEAAENKE